ncbi:centromere protein T [Hoplias malabaricus]|uniref:centromere protein T n=1 Tax=Hoplias malabaricus TaxID=27720 RepID=UPI0034636709
MDSMEEDVSARVLLKNVLQTELARSPVTRSASHNRTDSVRRSTRLRKTPGNESPQATIRHKLKQKLHEISTQSPLPPSKRPRSQGRAVKTPAVASSTLYDEDITARGLLRGIIQTEAESSLLLSGQPVVPETNQQLVETSLQCNRHSEGPSGLELPDLVTEPLTNLVRGMSRRRPPPTFNVSAFERQLDQQSGEENEVTQDNTDLTLEKDLTPGSKSALSLTLKTPFVNIQSERAGLRRKAASRRQPSVDAFDEAVQKRFEKHCNQDYTVVQGGKSLEDSEWQKFTLGLSNVTVPDLSTDIVMSNTELYPQPSVSVSERKEDEGSAPKMDRHDTEEVNEMDENRDEEEVGSELQEVPLVDDHQKTDYEQSSKTLGTEPEPFQLMEDPKTGSLLQNEEQEEIDMLPSSKEEEAVSLSPDELLFAPTQAIAVPAPEIQEQEWISSEIHEDMLDQIERKESGKNLSHDELPSQFLERISRRAYRSEGGAVMPGVTGRGRSTKSLGAGLYPSERKLSSFTYMGTPEKLHHLEEESYVSPSSPSISPTVKPSLSMRHQTSSAEVEDDREDVSDIGQSEDEIVVNFPIHQSPSPDSPAEKEDQQEEEDDEDTHSEELSMQTPAFVRQRKDVPTPSAMQTPTVLKLMNTGPAAKVVRPQPRQKKQTTTNVLPRSYVMSVFKHFAKTKVASDVYPVINEILQKYFDRLADDLEAYSAHANRKTIEVADVELLMRRQGFVTESIPVDVLIEKFLPLEYRKLLIPVATSGNKVIPDQRR